MGCDIHAFAELKKREDWYVGRAELEIERDYRLFSQLAGVRGNPMDNPIARPKGLPTYLGWKADVERNEWKEDMHSASWFTFAELEKAKPAIYDYKRDDWYLMLEALAKRHGKRNVRLVFWFDN